MILVDQGNLRKVQHLDQAKSLVRAIKPETETIGGELQDNRLEQRIRCGVGNADCGVTLGMRFETTENIVQGASQC
jgi:hypothetical protein